MFDAECDMAAIVFGAHEDPDRLLLEFLADLRRSGFQAAGLVQLDRNQCADAGDIRALSLVREDIVSLPHDRSPNSCACLFDTARLGDMARAIDEAIGAGVDLVVINRFGKLEAEGKGLTGLIEHASDADIPVLIPVPEHRFYAWIQYSRGMSVRLACCRNAVNKWWRSVARASRLERDGKLLFLTR